jgi:peptide-methionine (R)-S-oxide reductase
MNPRDYIHGRSEAVMNRRKILTGVLGVATLPFGLSEIQLANAAVNANSIESIHAGWRVLLPANAVVAGDPKPLNRDVSAWRTELPSDVFEVLFKEGTERPFSSHLNDEKRHGVFVCRACDLPLFSSEMKYDSGTGWPSFFTNIPDHLATKTDFKLIWPRTEYHCVKCGGHQGHIFKDGPDPTGARWCNNGVALRFIPADA